MKFPIFFALLIAELGLLAGLHLYAAAAAERRDIDLIDTRVLVSVLGLTDLALWTEARYTRHPSQADRFAAFQDFPAAIEHFPAGSIVAPPAVLIGTAADAAPRSTQARR